MGIEKYPGSRRHLIEQHIASMRRYATELDSSWPLVRRSTVIQRVLKCARDVERAHNIILKQEGKL